MKLVICSGAGLSAESGIPTFRTSGGLWHSHSIDEVCNLKTFYPNYDKVHDFYNKRRVELKNVQPNLAHHKIAELSKRYEVHNLTTNVDDLLERAGAENIVHMHGLITEVVQNYDSDHETIIDIGHNELNYLDVSHYPLKPNVVFFNEYAPKYQDFSNIMADVAQTDIVIIVGSSENVFLFVENVTFLGGFYGKTIFVNPDIELCNKVEEYVTEVFNMNATDFFEQIEILVPELKA